MTAPISDAWIAEGCAKARDLLEQGLTNQAADVLRYVEIWGLGLTAGDRARRAKARQYHELCVAKGCDEPRGRNRNKRFCRKHAPKFDREPEMEAA